MIRHTKVSHRVRLSVTQLESREVPAGMIELTYEPGLLSIQGDQSDNHVRVEMPNRDQVVVSSGSGPIRFHNLVSNEVIVSKIPITFNTVDGYFLRGGLSIDTDNGNDSIEVIGAPLSNNTYLIDWLFVEVAGGNGDDHVYLDNVNAPLSISTGNGADLVTLRECYGHANNILYSAVDIDTGSGDDYVMMLGINSYQSLYIQLGAGDDVLEGDSTAGAGFYRYDYSSLTIDAGTGYDRLLNAQYFDAAWYELARFESIN